MKTATTLILFALLSFLPVCAEDVKTNPNRPDSVQNPEEPGAYKMVGTGDKQHENAIDIFIPKAYAEKKEKKFPVLWMTSCWGCKDFYRLEAWAEKNEFILVDLPKVEWNTKPEEAREMFKDAGQFLSYLRMHPSLRFICAIDRWVGHQAFSMYDGSPKSVAGLILSGVRYYTDYADVARQTTIVAIYGDKPDSLARTSEIRIGLDKLHKKTYNVMVHVMNGKNTTQPPDNKTLENLLDAVYTYQSVSNPGLGDKEMQENNARAEKYIADIANGGSVRERLDKLTALVKMPKLETLKFGRVITEEWYKAFVEAFKSASVPEAFTCLKDPSVDKLVKAMPAAYKRDFSGPYAEMTKNTEYLHEVAAEMALNPVLSKYDEAASRNDEKKLTKVKNDLADFIEKYSGTMAAETARSAKSSINVDVSEPKK